MIKEQFENLKIGDKLYVRKDANFSGYFRGRRCVIVVGKTQHTYTVDNDYNNQFHYKYVYLDLIFPKIPEYFKEL